MKKTIFFSLIVLLISTYNNSVAIPLANKIYNNTGLSLRLDATYKATCVDQSSPPPQSTPNDISAGKSGALFIGTDDPGDASLCLPRIKSLTASVPGYNPATIQNPDGIKIKDYTVSFKDRKLVIE